MILLMLWLSLISSGVSPHLLIALTSAPALMSAFIVLNCLSKTAICNAVSSQNMSVLYLSTLSLMSFILPLSMTTCAKLLSVFTA